MPCINSTWIALLTLFHLREVDTQKHGFVSVKTWLSMAYGKKYCLYSLLPIYVFACVCVRVFFFLLLASSRMLLISLVSYTQRESKPKPETNQIESRRHIWESRQHVFVQYLISYNTTDTWVQKSKIILYPTPAPSALNHFEPHLGIYWQASTF